MLPEFYIKGCGFSHSTSSTLYKSPNFFRWNYFTPQDINFFADNTIQEGVYSNLPNKYFWVVESRGVIQNIVNWIKENYKLVEENCVALFTHDKSIYDLSSKFHYLPSHGYWVEPKEYAKTKEASLISSNKDWLLGHSHRLGLVERFKYLADIWGRGIRDFENKEIALGPYRAHFCIENDSYSDYWSEKLLDGLISKCLIFYHGCPQDRLKHYFNLESIIPIDEFKEDMLSEEFYYSKMDAINDNFERALKYDIIEDIIWEKYIDL